MMPPDPKDDIASEWLNGYLAKLRFEQDFFVYPGSSRIMYDSDGKQNGISVKRPDIRLFSTGITKLYEMIIEGKDQPDIEYTPEQEKCFDDNMKACYPEVFITE